ncbi:MAG: hypothetical protein R3C56_25165 [Pirellulaceae bacterium]
MQADPFSLAMHKGQVRPNSPRAFEQMYPDGIPQVETVTTAPVSRRHRPRATREHWAINAPGGVGSPHMAPALSSRDAGRAGQDLPSEVAHGTLVGRIAATIQRPPRRHGIPCGLPIQPTQPSHRQCQLVRNRAGNRNCFAPSRSIQRRANIDALQTAAAANVDLNQLQLVLSEAVTQPMQLWSLQPIYESARYYVEHGGSAIERGRGSIAYGADRGVCRIGSP